MKTRSPYTELLFALSPSNNVTESLKTFGAEEHATEAIAVRFTTSPDSAAVSVSDSFASDLEAALKCRVDEFSTQFCDLLLVQQVYRPTTKDGGRLVGEICSCLASKNI